MSQNVGLFSYSPTRQSLKSNKIYLRPTRAFHKMGELGQYLVN
jgi:hypothetical protein